MATHARNRVQRAGFTLTELLIVIGIIAVLVAILIPTVNKVREAGFATDTASLIRTMDNAATNYYQDWQAYPGVFNDADIGLDNDNNSLGGLDVDVEAGTRFVDGGGELDGITGAENFVLSVLGGLVLNDAGDVVYDPSAVGRGPVDLRPGQGRTYSAYLDLQERDLSTHVVNEFDVAFGAATSADQDAGLITGRWVDESGAAMDSIVPEIVDRFPRRLPILVIRANQRVGRTAAVAHIDPAERPVYGLNQVRGYVGELPDENGGPYIGVGRKEVTVEHDELERFHGLRVGTDDDDDNGDDVFESSGADDNAGPYDGVPYLQDRANPGKAVKANSLVIISAGRDGVYGTRDDITNFGNVAGT